MNLPLTNHYGVPYTDAERELHISLLPAEIPPVTETTPIDSVASFALRNGIDALFEP